MAPYHKMRKVGMTADANSSRVSVALFAANVITFSSAISRAKGRRKDKELMLPYKMREASMIANEFSCSIGVSA